MDKENVATTRVPCSGLSGGTPDTWRALKDKLNNQRDPPASPRTVPVHSPRTFGTARHNIIPGADAHQSSLQQTVQERRGRLLQRAAELRKHFNATGAPVRHGEPARPLAEVPAAGRQHADPSQRATWRDARAPSVSLARHVVAKTVALSRSAARKPPEELPAARMTTDALYTRQGAAGAPVFAGVSGSQGAPLYSDLRSSRGAPLVSGLSGNSFSAHAPLCSGASGLQGGPVNSGRSEHAQGAPLVSGLSGKSSPTNAHLASGSQRCPLNSGWSESSQGAPLFSCLSGNFLPTHGAHYSGASVSQEDLLYSDASAQGAPLFSGLGGGVSSSAPPLIEPLFAGPIRSVRAELEGGVLNDVKQDGSEAGGLSVLNEDLSLKGLASQGRETISAFEALGGDLVFNFGSDANEGTNNVQVRVESAGVTGEHQQEGDDVQSEARRLLSSWLASPGPSTECVSVAPRRGRDPVDDRPQKLVELQHTPPARNPRLHPAVPKRHAEREVPKRLSQSAEQVAARHATRAATRAAAEESQRKARLEKEEIMEKKKKAREMKAASARRRRAELEEKRANELAEQQQQRDLKRARRRAVATLAKSELNTKTSQRIMDQRADAYKRVEDRKKKMRDEKRRQSIIAQRVQNFVMEKKQKVLGKIFKGWRAEARRGAMLGAKADANARWHSLARSLRSWRGFVVRQLRAREEKKHADAVRKEKTKMRLAMKFARSNALSRSFVAWQEFVHVAQHQRVLERRHNTRKEKIARLVESKTNASRSEKLPGQERRKRKREHINTLCVEDTHDAGETTGRDCTSPAVASARPLRRRGTGQDSITAPVPAHAARADGGPPVEVPKQQQRERRASLVPRGTTPEGFSGMQERQRARQESRMKLEQAKREKEARLQEEQRRKEEEADVLKAAEKKARIEEKRAAKEAETQKMEEQRRLREHRRQQVIKATQHRQLVMKKKYGWKPWRALIGRLREQEGVASKLHACGLMHAAFCQWKCFIAGGQRERAMKEAENERVAQRTRRVTVLHKGLHAFKVNVLLEQTARRRASKQRRRHLARPLLALWAGRAQEKCRERELLQARQEARALKLFRRTLLKQCVARWRMFVDNKRKEQMRARRQLLLKQKVKGWLADS